MYQVANLPAPLPIRIPFGLRDMGRCGKIETQKARRVTSERLADRFKKSFSRNILLADIRRGRVITKPILPYLRTGDEGIVAERNLWRVLNLNFRGCNIICSTLIKSWAKAQAGKLKVKVIKRTLACHQHNKNQI